MVIANTLKKLLLGRAFRAEEGRMTILERYDVSLYESKAWAFTVQKIYEAVGEEETFDIFRKAGQIAFEQAANSFRIKPSIDLMNKFYPIMDFFGWGKFTPVEYKHKKDELLVIVKLTNSPIVEHAKELFGKDSKVCVFFRAILSGVFSLVYKRDVIFKETCCYTKGAEFCVFEGRFGK